MAGNCDWCVDAGVHVGGMGTVRGWHSLVSRALRSMKRSVMMRCSPGTDKDAAFATVPDQRCTTSLSVALHRIRDTSHLVLGARGA